MFDFPNVPFIGQQVTGAGGIVYQWDGTKWAAAVPSVAYAPINNPVFTGDPQAPTPATADNDTSIATTAYVKNVIAAAPPPGAIISATAPTGQNPGAMWWDTNGGQLYILYNDGNSTQWVPASNIGLSNVATQDDAAKNVGRNLVHNPCFTVAQRGAGPWTASGSFTADRWFGSFTGGSMAMTTGAANDGNRAQIGDEACATIFNINYTGGGGVGDETYFQQSIEDVRRLAGKTVTVSWWATAVGTAPKMSVVPIQTFGTGGSPSGAVAVPAQAVQLTTTFTRYSLTFTLPSVSGKTLGTNNNSTTILRLGLSSGANNNATYGGIGVQTGNVFLWGVQLEIAQAGQTQPSRLDYGGTPQQVLAECQRFYQTLTGTAGMYATGSGDSNYITVSLLSQMRANPTVAVSPSGGQRWSAVGISAQNGQTITMFPTANAAGQVSFVYSVTASADL